MTNKDLAGLIDYSGAALGEWLNQGSPMPGDAIIQIAHIFKLTNQELCEELLGYKQKQKTLVSPEEILDMLAEQLARRIKT